MTVMILQGDAVERLRGLPDESVHCCVTSPPYWGLRDYGVDGQIGLEATPDAWAAAMVEVFREVRRVLRRDGTCWVNVGDKHSSGGRTTYDVEAENKGNSKPPLERRNDGLKPKDLIGLPWLLAFALRVDGWWLRQEIIWAKPNPMPESARDRPTSGHEQIFLLSKAARYFYDGDAVRQPHAEPERGHGERDTGRPQIVGEQFNRSFSRSGVTKREYNPAGANLRSVWTIATHPYPDAHFATFPPEIPRRCILAGTSAKGVCADCGAPWVRKVEKSYENPGNRSTNGPRSIERKGPESAGYAIRLERHSQTTGWLPSCRCDAEIVPATVLDPFLGAGTTALVADQLGRSAIGIEINPEYAEMARRRIYDDSPLFAEIAAE